MSESFSCKCEIKNKKNWRNIILMMAWNQYMKNTKYGVN